uniref:Uncharacterized protein n=1 Tax=Caenorhabditis japonica TaxID=281687 RepID=A0A8R1I465_CAEJA
MPRSQHEIREASETVRHLRRTDEEPSGRTAPPPPYIGQAIPRVKPIRTFQKTSSNNNVGENSRPTSRRFDTFGENALETVRHVMQTQTPDGDTFFADLRPVQVSRRVGRAAKCVTNAHLAQQFAAHYDRKKRRERRPATLLYCVLPTLELLAAVAIIATSFSANRKELAAPKEPTDTSLATEAVRSLSIQNALSTVVPAFFQIVSSFFGFFPIYPSSFRRPAQILHIFFNSTTIILWFNAIYDLMLKVSMEHILKPSGTDEKYIINLIVGSFIYFATVIVPAITLAVAVYSLTTSSHVRRIQKSLTAISVSLGTLIFALATLAIAIFMAQANLGGGGDGKNLSDNPTMIAYGLMESIVFVFVLLTSIFSLLVALQNNRPLMIAAAIGQGISILSIAGELFTSERISAIFAELKSFETTGTAAEIGIVLLNGCSVVSAILLVLQLVVFIFCVSALQHTSQHSLLVDNNRNPGGPLERTAF